MKEKVIDKILRVYRRTKKELTQQSEKEFFYHYCYENLSQKKKILDIGCGVGTFLRIGKGSSKYFGMDWNLDSLSEAKRISKNLVQGDILNLPFPENSFDGINCSHVIEHLEPDKAHQLLVEMDQILTEGGIMALSVPVLWDGFYEDLTHLKPYYPKAILHYLGKNKKQTTIKALPARYAVVGIKWRYHRSPLKPVLVSKVVFLNVIIILLVQVLNNLGFGIYTKNAYTMILQKLASNL